MCFFSKLTCGIPKAEKRFNATFDKSGNFQPSEFINGFSHPKTPVISSDSPDKIRLFQWGLVPHWAKDESIKKYTLNAKAETIHQKPSFKYSALKRCLIIADGFYEWQWLDPKGKSKQKYLITLPDSEPFAFGGIWAEYKRPSGEILHSYSIVTLAANELMSRIHNSKKRMPLILPKAEEEQWLSGKSPDYFFDKIPTLSATQRA